MSETTIIFRGGESYVVGPAEVLTGLGQDFTRQQRASHIEPVNPLLRFVFHWIRYFGHDDSPAVKWTRMWRCLWRVNVINGPTWGAYTDRQEAIQDEVNYLIERLSDMDGPRELVEGRDYLSRKDTLVAFGKDSHPPEVLFLRAVHTCQVHGMPITRAVISLQRAARILENADTWEEACGK